MDVPTAPNKTEPLPPVYIVSGGTGSSGELVVHTALAQFAGCHVPVILVPRIRALAQLEDIVTRAADDQGTVVHTFVDPILREGITRLGVERRVSTIDLMGPLLTHLSRVLGRTAVGQPGLYQQLNAAYLERVQAIDFTMRHDDGLRPEELPKAEIVVLGVSRTGKTPLSMYLAVLGWKVANIPIISGQELPAELRQVERRRIIGLIIDPDQLVLHRRSRQRLMGGTLPAEYTSATEIHLEVEHARRLYRDRGFTVIDVTGKPLETTAEEIVSLIGAD